MSNTVKLIIEIPKEALELLNTTGVDWLDAEHILSAVANGIPLDEVKAEFINSYPTNDMGKLVSDGTMFWFSLNKVLQFLDNIGKADMRGEQNGDK